MGSSCPAPPTDNNTKAIFQNHWRGLGARIICLNPYAKPTDTRDIKREQGYSIDFILITEDPHNRRGIGGLQNGARLPELKETTCTPSARLTASP